MFPLDLTVAVYAFCVRSNNAYITAQLGLYSVYTSVDTRIHIMKTETLVQFPGILFWGLQYELSKNSDLLRP